MKLIKEIKITNFSINNITKNIVWELDADVNILEGINGSGKSTLLDLVYETLRHKNKVEEIEYKKFARVSKMELVFFDDTTITIDEKQLVATNPNLREEPNLQQINIELVRSFETENSKNIYSINAKIEMMKQYFVTQKSSIASKTNEILKNTKLSTAEIAEKLQNIYAKINLFSAKIKELFKETAKDFDNDRFVFLINYQTDKEISYELLSSGEKQLFLILLTVLLQDNKPTILLLDEPEISLHITWQRKLIRTIRELNPNCQIIMATHSTSMFIEGWANKFVRMNEIMTDEPIAPQPAHTYTQEQDTAHFWEIYAYKVANNNPKKDGIGRLFVFNQALNQTFHSIDYALFTKLLGEFQQKEQQFSQANQPDVVTFTTFISKATSFDDAKKMYEEITKYNQEPNILTFNIWLKKIENIEEGKFVLDKMQEKKVYPDIITFSTLLGKAKSGAEAQEVEKLRLYYSIDANDLYLNKLKFKK